MTNEQEEWLEEWKGTFIEANQRKAAAKEFFPSVCREFRAKWPLPPVTVEEIEKSGSVEGATKSKQQKYDQVGAYRYRRGQN